MSERLVAAEQLEERRGMRRRRTASRRRRRLPGDGGFVYAIGPPAGPLVKLGRTADSMGVALRMRGLQSQSPIELVCLAAIGCVDKKDLAATEFAVHALFRDERQHGEWFTRSARIDAAIGVIVRSFGRVVDSTLIPESVPALRALEEAHTNAAEHWEELVDRWWRRHFSMSDKEDLPPAPLPAKGFYDDLGQPFDGTGFAFVNGRLFQAVSSA